MIFSVSLSFPDSAFEENRQIENPGYDLGRYPQSRLIRGRGTRYPHPSRNPSFETHKIREEGQSSWAYTVRGVIRRR